MGKRISTAALLLLFGLAAPSFASAAVVVAEPTGDAEPAFLAELKASLETVAAEATPELNAILRASATNSDAGVELVVELVPSDGDEPIRETRTASRASALAQARAMGRAAIRALVVPKSEAVSAVQKKVKPEPEPEPETPPPPPLPVKYDRKKALRMTVLPTVLFPLAGAGILSLGFLALDNDDGDATFFACTIFGSIFMATGLIFGPMNGYFYVGRTRHALAMSGLRLALLGTGVASTLASVLGGLCDEDESCNESPGWMVLSITSLTALVLVTYVDASLVGRAADRANEQWRESQKVKVQVAPIAWSSGNGGSTFGLAVSGTF
jgi:hypothetical protein